MHLGAWVWTLFWGLSQAWAGYDVGVLIWSETIPGQIAMRQGLEAEAGRLRAAGASLQLHVHVAGDGEKGIERQIRQMEALVAQGVDAIVVQPTDSAALSAPLRKANAAGIPVVAYDQYIRGGDVAAYLTSDNRQAGRLDGEYIAARFPDDRPLRLVLVEYPHVSSTIERVDGFMDALEAAGQPVTVVGTFQGVDPVSGARAAAQLLAAHPEKGSVDVVFTVNDGGGLAVVDALAAAGRDEIVVATIDGDPASVANVRAGRLTVIDAAQFCGELGAAAMRATYAVVQGKPVERHQLVPTFPITRETVDLYEGWAAPLPEAVALPWSTSEPQWRPTLRGSGVADGPR